MIDEDVKLVGSTLREGEQAAGVAFKPEEKLRVALYDDEIGISMIEVFAPYFEQDVKTIKLIKDAGLVRSELMLWNRLRKDDVDSSLRYDPDWIGMAVGFSDVHVNKKFGKSICELMQACAELIDYAHSHGVKVSLHMEDSTRTEMRHLEDIVKELCPDKFRDCDTLSVLVPEAATCRLKHLTNIAPKLFEVHYHNDRGMAVANSISALAGGAKSISATWNGLGERAGNAPMEEILLILWEQWGLKKFDLLRVGEVCDFVSKASRVPIPRFKPVTGRYVFTVQSGIHQDGLLRDRKIYEPYPPEILGRKWRFVIGATSGRSGLAYVLNHQFRHRLPEDEQKQLEILQWARDRAIKKKGYLSKRDVKEMIRHFKLRRI
jgi:isopropylmalate/homocitrate/citramalate synthase